MIKLSANQFLEILISGIQAQGKKALVCETISRKTKALSTDFFDQNKDFAKNMTELVVDFRNAFSGKSLSTLQPLLESVFLVADGQDANLEKNISALCNWTKMDLNKEQLNALLRTSQLANQVLIHRHPIKNVLLTLSSAWAFQNFFPETSKKYLTNLITKQMMNAILGKKYSHILSIAQMAASILGYSLPHTKYVNQASKIMFDLMEEHPREAFVFFMLTNILYWSYDDLNQLFTKAKVWSQSPTPSDNIHHLVKPTPILRFSNQEGVNDSPPESDVTVEILSHKANVNAARLCR